MGRRRARPVAEPIADDEEGAVGQMLVARKMMQSPESDPGNPAQAASVAVAPMPRYPEGLHLAVGAVIFVLGILLVALILPGLFPDHSITFSPVDGVSAFALFFLAATVVERAIEPFASGLVRATPQWSTGTSGNARGAGSQRAAGASGPLAALGKTKAEALTMRSSLIARVVDGRPPTRARTRPGPRPSRQPRTRRS